VSTEKLQKVLAAAGLASRRASEQWISDGRVSVNGKPAKLGDRVGHQDKIIVDGKPVKRADHNTMIQCLIYHKPEGEICAVTDPKGRPTVFENLPPLEEGRWISVGRLDFNTSGLLLFTNNGDLANKLMHPSTNLTRRYMARIRGDLDEKDVETITRKGVKLDGKTARFEQVQVMDRITPGANNWIEVSIKEGRYREVRRILEAVEHPVSRLKRIQYGTVKLTTSLKVGKFESMAPLQLEKLLLNHNLEEFMPLVRKANIGKKFTKADSSPSQSKGGGRTKQGGEPTGNRSKGRGKAAPKSKYSKQSSDSDEKRDSGRSTKKPSRRSTSRSNNDSNYQSKPKRGKRTRS